MVGGEGGVGSCAGVDGELEGCCLGWWGGGNGGGREEEVVPEEGGEGVEGGDVNVWSGFGGDAVCF